MARSALSTNASLHSKALAIKRSVDWLGLHEGEYRPIERSGLIKLGADVPGKRIDWP